MNYEINIYLPNTMEPRITIESKVPFAAISKGDLVTAASREDMNDDRYRVIAVEHIISRGDDEAATRHSVCIYTEKVEEEVFLKEIGVSV
jgi:hypothetical protein